MSVITDIKNYRIMKNILLIIFGVLVLVSCSDDFLDNPPPTGLSEDKLTDLASMQGLVNGA